MVVVVGAIVVVVVVVTVVVDVVVDVDVGLVVVVEVVEGVVVVDVDVDVEVDVELVVVVGRVVDVDVELVVVVGRVVVVDVELVVVVGRVVVVDVDVELVVGGIVVEELEVGGIVVEGMDAVGAAFATALVFAPSRAKAGSGDRSPRHPAGVHTTINVSPVRNEKLERLISLGAGAPVRTLRGAAVTNRPGNRANSGDAFGDTPNIRRPSRSRRPSRHRLSPFASQLNRQSGTADAAAATAAIMLRASPI